MVYLVSYKGSGFIRIFVTCLYTVSPNSIRWQGSRYLATTKQRPESEKPGFCMYMYKESVDGSTLYPHGSGQPYVYNAITPTQNVSAHASCHRHISICPELWGGSNSKTLSFSVCFLLFPCGYCKVIKFHELPPNVKIF